MKKNTRKKKKSTHKKTGIAQIKGILEITRSGMGYVIINDMQKDIIIKNNNIGKALDGDTVSVRIIKKSTNSGRLEGKIIEIIERKNTTFVGTLALSPTFGFVTVHSDKPMPDIFIPIAKVKGAKDKDKVQVKLIQWDDANKKPEGEILQVITPEEENNIAMQSILTEHLFPTSFPDEVLAAANQLDENISDEEYTLRKDCRNITTFTIDPTDAKDFDDAISVEKINDNLYQIGIHIADVSHYVQPQSILDEEAYKRATSVYLPDRVNPMLPEQISNVLCSLRPHEEKRAFSAIFTISTNGKIKDSWYGKTVINSNHRFTYEEAQAIIDGENGPFKEEILLLHHIAQQLRAERFQNGAINFSSTEVRFKLDENAKPIDVELKESKPAHQLVEEFMLLANKSVATYIFHSLKNHTNTLFPYRVHDTPDEEKLQAFLPIAAKFGFKINISSPSTIAESFNQMLVAIKNHPEWQFLEPIGIRTMAKASYSTHNIGHYGLGFSHYCHFTSPIRRYPDVLVHRILQNILQENFSPIPNLESMCLHCSQQEKNAMNAERDGNKYKQIEFMSDRLGEEFEGIISGIASFGFWVETVEHKCEGLVSTFSLSEYDSFEYLEKDLTLKGIKTKLRFKMGDKVKIQVTSANLDKRQMDYKWVPNFDIFASNNKSNKPKKITNKKKK